MTETQRETVAEHKTKRHRSTERQTGREIAEDVVKEDSYFNFHVFLGLLLAAVAVVLRAAML